MKHISLDILSQTIILLNRQLESRQNHLVSLYAPGALRQSSAFYRYYRETNRLAQRIGSLQNQFCQRMNQISISH